MVCIPPLFFKITLTFVNFLRAPENELTIAPQDNGTKTHLYWRIGSKLSLSVL